MRQSHSRGALSRYVCNVLANYTCVAPRFGRWCGNGSNGKDSREQHPLAQKTLRKSSSTDSLKSAHSSSDGGVASRASPQEVIKYKASFIAMHFARMLARAERGHGQGKANQGCLSSEGTADWGFRPRGMVVCRSRADVVAFTLALRCLLAVAPACQCVWVRHTDPYACASLRRPCACVRECLPCQPGEADCSISSFLSIIIMRRGPGDL